MKKSLTLSALFALILSACQPLAEEEIKLGFIGPLTGDAAAIGADMLHGVQWAVEKINEGGGIDGRMVKLITEDGRCTGSEAANAAQKLVNVDKVRAIVGGLCSGETLAAAPIAEAAKVVLLSPGSSSPDVTDAGDFVFRNYPSDALKTTAMAQYFAEQGYEKVAMISENTDFSQAFRAALKEKVGAEAVAFDEVVEPGTKDFRSLLTRLKSVAFDVFFPNPNGDAVMAVMVQQFREAGFTQPMISHDVAESLSIVQIAGDAAEGFRLINVPTAGEGGAFESMYVEKFGNLQSSIAWAAFSYDATNVLSEAMRSAGTEGSAIRDELYSLEGYEGVVGKFRFDDNGDVLGVPYVLKEFKDGKIVKVQDITLD